METHEYTRTCCIKYEGIWKESCVSLFNFELASGNQQGKQFAKGATCTSKKKPIVAAYNEIQQSMAVNTMYHERPDILLIEIAK